MVVVKCCSGCGVVKSLDDFHRNRNNPDGRAFRCKECKNAYDRRYREENPDWMRERRRRCYEGNRDKERERRRRYREENREYVHRQGSRNISRYQSVTKSAATKRGRWSEAEIAILMADDGCTLVAKALELGRTYSSCQSKRKYLHSRGVTN